MLLHISCELIIDKRSRQRKPSIYFMHIHLKKTPSLLATIFSVSFFVSALATPGLQAQDMQSNPLSRMGYGTLDRPVSTAWRGMGGVGVGMNDAKVINLKNPAAYAGTDSLSFLMEVGVSVNMGHFKELKDGRTTFLGGLDYIAMQFPLYRDRIGLSLGVKPLSSAGYGLVTTAPVKEGSRTIMLQSFTGRGALQKAYIGLAGRLFERLYIGANVNYLFGHLTHTVATTPNTTFLSQTIFTHSIRLNDVSADLGVQYRQPLYNEGGDFMVFGATYAPSVPLKPTFVSVSNENAGDPLRPKTETKTVTMSTTTPHRAALGFSWTRPDKYALGVDVAYSAWEKVPNIFAADGVSLMDSFSAAVGFEYLPNVYSRKYEEVIKYRFGLSYSGAYMSFAPVGQAQTLGASFGMGLPVNFFGTDRPSMLNLSLNYDRTFGAKGSGISMDVLRLSLGIAFNETWFRELKIY